MILMAAPAVILSVVVFYFILFFRFSLEGAERVTRSDIQGRLFRRKAPEKAMLVLNIITFA